MGGPLIGVLQGLADGDTATVIAELIVLALLLLIAFPFHELAHAVVAKWLGDDTAERLGRITLNPLKHLDPVGSLLFAISGFGWAKPVPVNAYRLNGNPRTSFAIVALAGPVSNLLLATIFAVLFRVLEPSLASMDFSTGRLLSFALISAISLNVFLALFNLIPVPPLDGSRLLAAILPESGQSIVDQLERYGFIILIGLSVTGLLGRIIIPPANFLMRVLIGG